MVRPTCYIQTDRVGAGGGPDDGGGLLPNTEPVVADDPPKTDDDEVEAGSGLAWLLFETLKTTSIYIKS